MPYLKMVLSYDGTRYAGWQIQPQAHGPTVQGEVRKALARLTGEDILPVAAGRTDAGVHARGQVISFYTRTAIPLDRWPLALNSLLPPDIAALEAEEVGADFHACYSARWKWYRYTIYNNWVPDVFLRLYSWHIRFPLNLEAMAEGARHFLGRHDFRSFCASGHSVRTYVREVIKAEVKREGHLIYFDVVANGFLYNMVRIMVGTLVEIGRGKIHPNRVPDIIAARSRMAAGPTAPPHGLCLEKVYYAEIP
ncbi:MAG TPA: tRNA pseudouridine(38-40) synthase TruA [Moorella mulderi]|nr:tRNA pseudouridine(38-40) synthase TruA [Moorella mulderi]